MCAVQYFLEKKTWLKGNLPQNKLGTRRKEQEGDALKSVTVPTLTLEARSVTAAIQRRGLMFKL